MSERKLLFSVTKKDLVIEMFRAGGPGGQHQNRRNTGVRIKHPDSGAVGESREQRSQHQNKMIALRRLADSREFRLWVRIRAAEIALGETIDEKIDRMMHPKNLIVEGKDNSGQWTPLPSWRA